MNYNKKDKQDYISYLETEIKKEGEKQATPFIIFYLENLYKDLNNTKKSL